MTYLLDTDVFVQAKNLHYGFDFCPGFWDWISQEHLNDKVFSIDKVQDELIAGKDELSEWAKQLGSNFFLKPDKKTAQSFGLVSKWVNDQSYESSAMNTFFQVADYYLICHALGHNKTVVTHEVPSDSARKIKIPNVCIGLGIECINPFQLLRREKARLII